MERRREPPRVADELLRADANREWRVSRHDLANNAGRYAMSISDAFHFCGMISRHDYATLRLAEEQGAQRQSIPSAEIDRRTQRCFAIPDTAFSQSNGETTIAYIVR